MYRGSTPVHKFHTNIDLRGSRVYITYSQEGKVIVEKSNEDIEFEEQMLTTKLSQEETLMFSIDHRVEIQIRYVFPDGTADASKIIPVKVERILKDGVIAYEA